MLEHIEPECLDDVLDDMHGLSKKSVFLTIATAEALKKHILMHLKELRKMPIKKIQSTRYNKFRAHGQFNEKELKKTKA